MGREESYIVEKVVGKRITKGKPEYYVKWEGYPSSQNTWEPRQHLTNCLDLIEAYENRKKEKLNTSGNGAACRKRSSKLDDNENTSLNKSDLNTSSNKKRGRSASKGPKTPDQSAGSKNLAGVTLNDCEEYEPVNGKNSGDWSGFGRDGKPVEIQGAVENEGVYCFLIKWENRDETDLVPAKVAHKECPQLVIQFYEKRISWKNKT